MTYNQTRIYEIILNSKKGITLKALTKEFYKGVRKDMLPKNQNNSVLAIVRQLQTSVKLETINRGCKGLFISLS